MLAHYLGMIITVLKGGLLPKNDVPLLLAGSFA